MKFTYRARSPVFAALFAVCAAWLVTVGVLWLTTGRTVPTVNVRWVSGIVDESRSTAERDLSLVLHEPRSPDTASYFLTDANPPNVERLVLHPLVEDTAGLNRGSFALEDPQYVRMWIGDRFTTLRRPVLLYLSVFGCLFSGAILGLGMIRRHFPVELARFSNVASPLVSASMAEWRRFRRDRLPLDQQRLLPHWTTGWITAAVWLSAFVWSVAAFSSRNDHFDRISRARQIAVYGEIPFRDFFDPGYFMSLFSSAGLQLLLGDNLLGEMLLVTTLTASGTTLVFLLARNVAASSTIAVLAALVALLALPVQYDYDKCFFYPLGVFLCWRYIDQRRLVDIVMLGVGAVAAGVFRYDSGVYVMCAALMTVMVLHAGAVPVLVRRVAVLFGVVAIAAIPFLLFLQIHGGLLDAVQQVVTYAQREGARTDLLRLEPVSIAGPLFTVAPMPRVGVGVRWTPAVDEADRKDAAARYGLSDERSGGGAAKQTWVYELEDASTENIRRLISDPRVEATNGINRSQATLDPPESRWTRLQRAVPLLRNRVLFGVVFHRANAIALLQYLFLGIPLVAAISVWRWPINPDREGRRVERARVLGLAAMCIVTAVFILRDPLPARVGGMVGPAAVLWAWLFSRGMQTGARGEGHARPLVGLLRTTPAIAVGVVVLCLAVSQEWSVYLGRIAGRLPFVAAKLGDVSESPVGPHWMPVGRINPLASYVRDCTDPVVDRVLATWFVPELYFFSQRGFAAGMVVTFGGHWSERQYQERSVELWARQSVPIVIVKTDEYEDFRVRHSLLDTYLREHYAVAGRTNFGDPEMNDAGYTVWTRTDRAPVRTHPTWQMPCFA